MAVGLLDAGWPVAILDDFSNSDPRVDAACAAHPHIDAFLKQRTNERTSTEETQARLLKLGMLANARR